jgi:hypothetical protein
VDGDMGEDEPGSARAAFVVDIDSLRVAPARSPACWVRSGGVCRAAGGWRGHRGVAESPEGLAFTELHGTAQGSDSAETIRDTGFQRTSERARLRDIGRGFPTCVCMCRRRVVAS